MKVRAVTTRREAFTLVEIVVVLVIMSMLLVTMTQMLSGARSTRDLIHNIQETQLAGPAILDAVERDLRAVFVLGRAQDRHLTVRNRIVSGLDADAIEFVTATTGLMVVEDMRRRMFVRPDYAAVAYVARQSPRDSDFLELYRRESFGIGEDPSEGGRYALLSDRIRGFEVAVFEEDGPDAEPLENWGLDDPARVGLPNRLELTLTLELSPRLVREQLTVTPLNRRTLTYRRVIRFPEALREATVLQPLPAIPQIEPPSEGGGPMGGPGPGGEGAQPGTPGLQPPTGGPTINPGELIPGTGGGAPQGGAIPNPFGGG
jgi:hypothetical protein